MAVDPEEPTDRTRGISFWIITVVAGFLSLLIAIFVVSFIVGFFS